MNVFLGSCLIALMLGAVVKELSKITDHLAWLRARQEREDQHMVPPHD
jgi:hypothetical protein